jgi:hypothetical protein
VERDLYAPRELSMQEHVDEGSYYYDLHPTQEDLMGETAVIKGVSYQDIRSWRVSKSGPPQVVLEILVANEGWLRLYDREGHLRLTGEEARTQQAEIEARRAQAEARRAEQETGRAETAARRAQALAEKLRTLAIDPDQISYSS